MFSWGSRSSLTQENFRQRGDVEICKQLVWRVNPGSMDFLGESMINLARFAPAHRHTRSTSVPRSGLAVARAGPLLGRCFG
jgi:hypothetical protein